MLRALSVTKSSQPRAFNFIKKETLTQVLTCDFCEISKNTFFKKYLWTTASDSLTIEKTATKF